MWVSVRVGVMEGLPLVLWCCRGQQEGQGCPEELQPRPWAHTVWCWGYRVGFPA